METPCKQRLKGLDSDLAGKRMGMGHPTLPQRPYIFLE